MNLAIIIISDAKIWIFKKTMRYLSYGRLTCRIISKFKISGLSALLVYRSGELVSLFVRLSDTLGEDFYASDLESFLIENGVLSDAKLMPSIIRSSLRDSGQDSD